MLSELHISSIASDYRIVIGMINWNDLEKTAVYSG
jgi:hypothetical protein